MYRSVVMVLPALSCGTSLSSGLIYVLEISGPNWAKLVSWYIKIILSQFSKKALKSSSVKSSAYVMLVDALQHEVQLPVNQLAELEEHVSIYESEKEDTFLRENS